MTRERRTVSKTGDDFLDYIVVVESAERGCDSADHRSPDEFEHMTVKAGCMAVHKWS